MKNIKKTYRSVTFTPINPSLLQTSNTDTQPDLRPRQMKLRQQLKIENLFFSETKGRRSHLFLNSLSLFFETN